MIYRSVAAGCTLVFARKIKSATVKQNIASLIPLIGAPKIFQCRLVILSRLLLGNKGEPNIGIIRRRFVGSELRLLRAERHRLGVENKSVEVGAVDGVEQLHRLHHVADCRLRDIVQHGKVTLAAVDGIHNTLRCCTVAVVLKAVVILVLRYSAKERKQLLFGDGRFIRWYRVRNVQIERPCAAVLLCVALAVGEVKSAPIEIGVAGLFAVKHSKVTVAAAIHHAEIALCIHRLTLGKICRLLFGKSVAITIFEGKFYFASSAVFLRISDTVAPLCLHIHSIISSCIAGVFSADTMPTIASFSTPKMLSPRIKCFCASVSAIF